MARIKLTGEVTISVVQYLDLPEDEVQEFLEDTDNYDVNVDLEECQKEIMEWHFLDAERV